MLGFIASLALPAPSFLRGMEGGELSVWLAQLAWVLGLPLGLALILGFIRLCRRGPW